MPVNEELIKDILARLAPASNKQLIAGVAVLVKNAESYLLERESYGGEEKFRRILDQVKSSKKEIPLDLIYEQLKNDKALPTDFTGDVNTLDGLLAEDIINETTISAGEEFFNRFATEIRKSICEDSDSPYLQSKNKSLNRASLPTAVAATILMSGLSVDTFWYPLAVSLSLLILRRGLSIYCDESRQVAL